MLREELGKLRVEESEVLRETIERMDMEQKEGLRRISSTQLSQLIDIGKMHTQLEVLPSVVNEVPELRASDAAQTAKAPLIADMLTFLGLKTPFTVVPGPDPAPAISENLSFRWAVTDKESDSYDITVDYISRVFLNDDGRLRCARVDNGRHTIGKRLYKAKVWSLRQDPNEHGQRIMSRLTVFGETDLIVFCGPPKTQELKKSDKINKSQVRLAVEIKIPSCMRTVSGRAGAEREVIAQLLGLNLDSPYTSPPVLLTDLVNRHTLYFVRRVCDNPLDYEICVQECGTFGQAVSNALSLGTRRGETADFGRPATPIERSPAGSPTIAIQDPRSYQSGVDNSNAGSDSAVLDAE